MHSHTNGTSARARSAELAESVYGGFKDKIRELRSIIEQKEAIIAKMSLVS